MENDFFGFTPRQDALILFSVDRVTVICSEFSGKSNISILWLGLGLIFHHVQ